MPRRGAETKLANLDPNSREAMELMKVTELKDLLKKRNLSTVGKKVELVDRLFIAVSGASTKISMTTSYLPISTETGAKSEPAVPVDTSGHLTEQPSIRPETSLEEEQAAASKERPIPTDVTSQVTGGVTSIPPATTTTSTVTEPSLGPSTGADITIPLPTAALDTGVSGVETISTGQGTTILPGEDRTATTTVFDEGKTTEAQGMKRKAEEIGNVPDLTSVDVKRPATDLTASTTETTTMSEERR